VDTLAVGGPRPAANGGARAAQVGVLRARMKSATRIPTSRPLPSGKGDRGVTYLIDSPPILQIHSFIGEIERRRMLLDFEVDRGGRDRG
jgi:hypothetical protein